jgi:signal peptidase I
MSFIREIISIAIARSDAFVITIIFLPILFVPVIILSLVLILYRTIRIRGNKLKIFFMSFIIILISALTIRNFVAEARYITGDGMTPTIPIGTRIIIDKTSYIVMRPKRGDIVLFSMNIIGRNGATTVMGSAIDRVKISRIIAVPGDRVEIKEGVMLINNRPLPEAYINKKEDRTNYKLVDLETCESVKKKTGFKSKERSERVYTSCYYLFRGDNRTFNRDGMDFGLVPEQSIIGKVRAKFWPLDRVASI